ncbi:acetylornithine deacetylase (plasmid) [Azospirillum baldaniorum]|uniref:Acetylornithine deacetylase n=1 Tax=Azospirillum baldaniorum TaxID=1064539 RepID=A0A9P1K0G5_9PROT|nr:acetylornithine deacetylase [Azospirillum baldaniorum]AWJ94837.1 acetylornithine deacetylase [Azospirillum baldaniorum]TWA69818.1 acetylornithine deacetylase [Azospirillum brasilense]CCD03261.1 acetylornithine deacetylase [Azospirillum baldaniorum]
MTAMGATLDILERLVAFPTVSRDSNLDLILWAKERLEAAGATTRLVPSEDGRKANLFASVGPADRPGVLLSGHTDVVPVDGQAWTSDPFRLTRRAGNLYGRGTADMKGFVAAAMALAQRASGRTLSQPLHLALSYDEEVGCLGVRRLIDMMAALPVRPRFCIVGEPTLMQVVTAHKGKTALRIDCRGVECHSSLAPQGMNAIHMACDMLTGLRRLQERVQTEGSRDADYDVPWTTIHAGVIQGGSALNIVPNHCRLDMEIRHLPQDPVEPLLDAVRAEAAAIETRARSAFPAAAVEIAELSSYPSLDTDGDSEVVSFVKALTGGNSLGKISFGTEGGLFQQRLSLPTVVCGPGSIGEAHKPDEFIAEEQLAACDRMLDLLLTRLA